MRRTDTFLPLLLLAAMFAVLWSLYAFAGQAPPESVWMLTDWCLSLFIVYWLIIDARSRHRVPCHDFGFLVYIFMPVAVPWYLVWTRGMRGLLTLGAFAGLFLLPRVAFVVVWTLRFA